MKMRVLSVCAVLALFLSLTTTASANCGDWWNELEETCCENGQSYCMNDCPPPDPNQ